MTKVDNKRQLTHIKPIGLMIYVIVTMLTMCCSPLSWAEDSIVQQGSDNNSSLFQYKDGKFNFGLGIVMIDIPDSGINIPDDKIGGWDFLVGYEWLIAGKLRTGLLLHIINSWPVDAEYQSRGFFATARPENNWLRWVQFRAGIVSDHYSTNRPDLMGWDGTGIGMGMGIVFDNGKERLHLLGIERHFVAGRSFNSINLVAFGFNY